MDKLEKEIIIDRCRDVLGRINSIRNDCSGYITVKHKKRLKKAYNKTCDLIGYLRHGEYTE